MGRPMRNRSNYWSMQHKKLLLYTAGRVLRRINTPNVDIEDLVSIGWLHVLRYRPEDKLAHCFSILYKEMLSFVRHEIEVRNKNCEEYLNLVQSRESLSQIQSKMDCDVVLSVLNDRDRKILMERSEGKTLQEIGKDLKCSDENVRLLEKKALMDLQEVFSNEIET